LWARATSVGLALGWDIGMGLAVLTAAEAGLAGPTGMGGIGMGLAGSMTAPVEVGRSEAVAVLRGV